MKHLALLLALCLYITAAAGGNKPSDKKYRCFGQIGKSTSNTKNEYLSGGNKYCIPSPNTKNCQKSWLWELDKKNDRVTEMNSNCEYQCELMGVGGAYSDTPVETYQYCVYAPDFYKVAQCVDKQEGKDADNSKCDGDSSGTRYYYKPKCKENQTKEQCEASLRTITVNFGWRFCYKGSGQPGDMFKTMGGQTVQFQEYINDQGTASYPCNQNSSSPGGGNPPPGGGNPPEPEKPGAIVIRDWANSTAGLTQSIVWTKTSGEPQVSFRINTLDASGKVTSGINSLSCSFDVDDKAKAAAYKTSGGGFLGGIFNQVYRYDAKGVPFPFSGYHTLKCEGIDSNNKPIAGEVKFYSAPAYYKYDTIEFKVSNDTAPNGIIDENLISTVKSVSANNTETITYNDNGWAKKPVVKIGENLLVLARSIKPYTKQNQLDNQVNTGIGVEHKNTLKALASSGVPNTTTTQSCGNLTPNITTNSVAISAGEIDTQGNNQILQLSSQSSIIGTMELTMKDTDITNIIKTEEAQGKCGKGATPCPYPGTMKLVFDYQVVPNTFDIELLNANNQPLKVLYFGQGSNTSVEQPNKIRIKAYNLSKNVDTKFSSGCAAQDLAIDLNTKGLGYSIKLVDKDGVDIATIPAKDFKNGVAESNAFIKVMKADGIDFTPNMKSEPVFLKGGFPASAYFAGFLKFPNSYYPQYEHLLANANDMVILRGRINAIDTDNAATRSLVPTPTKVYYEFQCEYCDLSRLQKITGVANYQAQKSKTQQGWFIDSTFAAHNSTALNKNMVSIENQGSGSIKNVTGFVNGIQEIQYGNLPSPATHKLNILHGNYVDRGNAIAMPNFLLYNAYWSANTRWNTSAFIHMRGTAKDDNGRDYGLDTGGAKNTRSGGRTGGY